MSMRDVQKAKNSLKIFCCYARKDQALLLKLRAHLAFLEKEGSLSIWHDAEISPGAKWEKEINLHLDAAQIILLLISSDFLGSEYCYSKEMKRALERHERGEACVIPIILRPSIWQEAPFAKLQALPSNILPVTEWRNRDKAWLNIAQGIEQVVKELLLQQPLNTLKPQRRKNRLQIQSGANNGSGWCDWGEAPDVPTFFGRTKELLLLEKWIIEDHCRLIALTGLKGIGKTRLSVKLGKGGIGKTDLSLQLAKGIQEQFDYVIWRRLLNAPKVSEIIIDIIQFLSHRQDLILPNTVNEQVATLLSYLRYSRCLLILDNVEMLLQSGEQAGHYFPEYEDYGYFFEQIANVPHQSCLMLTSREKPPEIARLESKTGPVRSLEVKGLHYLDGKKIFAEIGDFLASKDDWKQLNHLYNGNPLALELVARHIKEVFFGNIATFLREGKPIFTDLRSLLDWHFNRLATSHKEVMYWFAINREPMSFAELKEDIFLSKSREQISSTIYSLQRLVPLEKSSNKFTLQPVLIEYVTERLIDQVIGEIVDGDLSLFNTHALFKTSVSEYVRDIQSRLILKPIGEKLLEIYSNPERLETRLRELLALLRERFHFIAGYAGGNLLNLLCYLQVDLRGFNFSSLSIWQAYLQGVNLPEVNFEDAHFAKVVFTDTFGSVLSTAFSLKGDLLAAGSTNGEVRIWNWASNTLQQRCQGHTGWVGSITFSPDGKTLVSGSEDCTVRIWDVNTGNCLKVLYGHQDQVKSISYSYDGQWLASSGDDQTIRLWDVKREIYLRTLQGHTRRVRSLAFNPIGDLIASGGDDQTIRLWDVQTGQCLNTLQEGSHRIWSVAFSPDGRLLASGGDSQTIRVWDVQTGQCLQMLQGHSSWIRSVAFSSNGEVIISGGDDKNIRVWNINTNNCIQLLQGHNSWIWSVSLDPTGKICASGGEDQTVRLWEIDTGRCLNSFQGYINRIWSANFSPDDTFVAAAGDDQMIQIWETANGQCVQALRGHTQRIHSLAISSNKKFIASGSEDQTIRIWDITSGECLQILRGHTNRVRSVCFSLDGGILASGSEDQTIRIWDINSGECLKAFSGYSYRIWSVALSPDVKLLSSGGDDQIIQLWDTGSGEILQGLEGHINRVYSVAFNASGKLLASGGEDQTVRIWEVQTGKCLRILRGHTHRVRSVKFHPDGKLVVSGSEDQTARIWDIQSGSCISILQGYPGPIQSVAFSSRGDLLVTSNHEGLIGLWDVGTGKILKAFRSSRPYELMKIKGVKGLNETQIMTLKKLGASSE